MNERSKDDADRIIPVPTEPSLGPPIVAEIVDSPSADAECTIFP